MLQGEHSAILSTFVKLPFVIIKIFVLAIFESPFDTGFTVFPQVRRVLLPVYLDFMEEEDIRMSAYLSFMDTRPPRPDLEIITRSILEEPSYNVGALVWANLMQLSNRTTTCNCIQSL